LKFGSGTCLAGHPDPIDCKSFQPEDSAQAGAISSDVIAEVSEGEAFIDARGRKQIVEEGLRYVYRAKALNADEANRLLYARPAKIAVFAGPVRVGKTTLLASIYESFFHGSVSNWVFAGSRTLIGFEERRFSADRRSGKTSVEPDHTSLDATDVFLHLRLRRDSPRGSENRDLLMADISGEHLSNLVTRNEPGQLGDLLPLADTLVYLVDGEAIGDKARCWMAIENAATGFRALVERNHLPETCQVITVVTKWDLCSDAPHLAEVLASLYGRLGVYVSERIDVHCAARPHPGCGIPEHKGVNDLLEALAMASPQPHLQGPEGHEPGDVPGRFIAGGRLLEALLTAARPV
jgi:hypothetical protein